ncbi:hypothetical protein JW948_13535 [bacterium]|nr:hypothetical protein [bacterium]
MDPVMIIAAFVVVILFIIILLVRYEKKRTLAIEEKAKLRGYSFTAKSGTDPLPDAQNIRLFKLGHSRRLFNMLQKNTDTGFEWIFDYQYIIGHGRNRQTHRQTVFLFHSSRLNLPYFEVRPEYFFHKIGKAFGYQDINFEQYPEFSKKYLLKGREPAAIQNMFTQEVVSFFEREKRICAESGGQTLIVFYAGKRVSPETLFEKLEIVQRLVYTLSRHSDFK